MSKDLVEENKLLIDEYPFLKINCNCDYNYTWLDDLESGWRKAFGEDLCRELKEAIEEEGCIDFEFDQIKEKYGSLRLYANGYTHGGSVDNVLSKYEELSKYICGHCGEYATKITRGWIYPLCNKCIEDVRGGYSDIEDFYDFDSYEDVLKEIEKIKTDYRIEDYWGKINE